MIERKAYPTDVLDEEWSFAAPYLTLMNEDEPQRRYELREMFNALRWMVRAGALRRMLPTNFAQWEMVYQQTHRWLSAGCFEAMVNDLRSVLRVSWSALCDCPGWTVAVHLRKRPTYGLRRLQVQARQQGSYGCLPVLDLVTQLPKRRIESMICNAGCAINYMELAEQKVSGEFRAALLHNSDATSRSRRVIF